MRERTESLQVASFARREQPLILAQQSRQHNVVVAVGQRRLAACLQLRECSALIDREIVDHRLHRKRHAACESSAHFAHQIAEALLRLGFPLGIEDESHPSARHAAQHPESPERLAKLRAHLADQSLGIQIARPRNDGLDRPVEVPLRRAANRAHVALAQIRDDLVQNLARRLPRGPLRVRAQQVSLRYHLQDRAHILRHAAMHQHQALLQPPARLRAHLGLGQNAVIRQQPAAADPELRIALCRQHALNQLDPRPNASGVLPASTRPAQPLAENRARRHHTPIRFLERPRQRTSPAPSPA